MTKPYVLTDDLSLAFSEFTKGRADAVDAVCGASDAIETSLRKFFPVVEKIPAEEIHGFLSDKVSQSALPVISLAGLIPSDGVKVMSVEASRTVKMSKNDGYFHFVDNGLLPRNSNLPAAADQFNNCVRFIKEKRQKSVNILDDVVFSGGTVLDYVDRLANRGIVVETIITNVATGNAVKRLEKRGVKVDADYVYEDVVDEVCMRDFIVGTPGGGRNLMTKGGEYVSVPYLYPFANVDAWASVSPDQAVEFSRDCLQASLNLWACIAPERKFGDLDKPVFKCDPNAKITDTLDQMLKEKKYARFANTL